MKILRRTIVLKAWTNMFSRKALREIEDVYRNMLQKMLDYTIEYSASQTTLHRIFYNRFRERYPWVSMDSYEGYKGML